MQFLYPQIYAKNIQAVPYQKLLDRNIKTLVFDIDNTLVPFDILHPTEELLVFFDDLQQMGFKICLLSNNNKKRVSLFNEKLNLLAVYKARKPFTKALNKLLNAANTPPSQAAIIGDQIFTDVWCGNKNKMLTILIRPVQNRESFGVFLKRGLERIVVKSFVKKVRNN
ncbi:MAG: YqeG family HAD IIIA-type phosphatase [Defluviitaleaceae bacterium]|nr:YqeG family HAD IIIA-type phosphatase [Defluviitaleaceae bacterium]